MEALTAAKQLVQAEEDEDEDLTPQSEEDEMLRTSIAEMITEQVEEFKVWQKDAKAAATMAGSQAAAEAKAAGGSLSERASAAARAAAAVVRQSFVDPLGSVAETEGKSHDDE